MSQTLLKTDEIQVNMGPQHPSTHGVLRLVLKTDGEQVREAVPHIGYLHRAAEKLGESVTVTQFIPYTDRVDYLAAMNNNVAFALAVEKIAGVEVPKRAQYLRVLVAELNRIASHLVAVVTFALDLGAFTPFCYAFREREMVLQIFERLCGARLTYSYTRIGGVMRDFDEDLLEDVKVFLHLMESRWPEYNQLLSYNEIFLRRTANVGVVTGERAIANGLTGPCLRGSGVKFDCRKAFPYSSYEDFDFEVPVGTGIKGQVGDCWDRYWVRMLEINESISICRQVLENLPDGPVMATVPKIIKIKEDEEAYVATENPRGELGFYVIGGGKDVLKRCRMRAPCFCNLSVTQEVARDVLMADVVAIIGSLDIVLGEVDR